MTLVTCGPGSSVDIATKGWAIWRSNPGGAKFSYV